MTARAQLADEITIARESVDWTLAQIATKTGVSAARLSMYMSNSAFPPWGKVERIVMALCPDKLDRFLEIYGLAENEDASDKSKRSKVPMSERVLRVENQLREVQDTLDEILDLVKQVVGDEDVAADPPVR